jgi:hypothetical protein
LTKVFTKGVTKGVSNDFFTKGFTNAGVCFREKESFCDSDCTKRFINICYSAAN